MPDWDDQDSPAWMHAARMAELGVLSASLLHELRQPLFAIKALSQLSVEQGQMSPEHILMLVRQIEHMQTLVDAYSGFSSPGESVVLFDLNDPVRNAAQMLAHRGRSQGASLDLDLAAGFLPVRARPSATQQVVVNLLANAYDAVEAGGGGSVSVHTEADEHMVRLFVRDTGPGVPQGLEDEVFEPFVTTKGPGQGTGLGLYIASKIVAEANGELVMRRDGNGTVFEVRLPRAA